MTFPSLLNMLTSSMAWMGWTLSFFSAVWSFLSSVPAALWTFLTFLRGVPLPLYIELASTSSNPTHFWNFARSLMLVVVVVSRVSGICGAGLSKIEEKTLAYPTHAYVSNCFLD
jgi:hypothetical protein